MSDKIKQISVNGKPVVECKVNGKTVVSTSQPNMRRILNDNVATIMNAVTETETKSYNGNQYVIQHTFEHPKFTRAGVGNANPWICSKHCMICANHYPNKPTGNITVDGVTMVRKPWVRLYDWAKDSGKWSQDYLNKLYNGSSLGDISMIPCDGDGFTDASIPAFLTKDYIKSHFWLDDLRGACGWSSSQATNWAIPIVFLSNHSWTLLSGSKQYLKPSDKQVTDVIDALPSPTYPIYEGDSGHVKYIYTPDGIAVVSQCYSASSGPDFVECFDVINEYVKTLGDELKTL